MRNLFGRAMIATMLVVSSASVVAAPAKPAKPTKPTQPPRPTPPPGSTDPTSGNTTTIECQNTGQNSDQTCYGNYPG